MIIVADTSALYASFDADQPEYEAAVRVASNETLILSPLVMAELDHLVHRDLGFSAAMTVMEALQDRMLDGQYLLPELSPSDMSTAAQVRSKYAALKLDLADAVGVVLADRYRTDRIFTLDQRDFRAVQPLTRGLMSFRILPGDA